jgi:hypothetical protein
LDGTISSANFTGGFGQGKRAGLKLPPFSVKSTTFVVSRGRLLIEYRLAA